MNDAGLPYASDQRFGGFQRDESLILVAGGNCLFDAAHLVAHTRAMVLVDCGPCCDFADGFFCRFRICHAMQVLKRS